MLQDDYVAMLLNKCEEYFDVYCMWVSVCIEYVHVCVHEKTSMCVINEHVYCIVCAAHCSVVAHACVCVRTCTYAQVYTHTLAHLLLQSSNAVLLCPECVPGLIQLLLEKVHLHLQFTGLLCAGGQLLGQKVESLLLLLDLSSMGWRGRGR